MKRCLLLLAVLAVVVIPVAANDVQTEGSYNAMAAMTTQGVCSWAHDISAGNSRFYMIDGSPDCLISSAWPSTGLAFNSWHTNGMNIAIYNVSGTLLVSDAIGCSGGSRAFIYASQYQPFREYCNGAEIRNAGNLTWPPSYYIFYPNGASNYIDDYGSPSETIIGMPEDGMYTIQYDPSGLGQSGVIRYDGVRVQEYLPITYSKYDASASVVTLTNAASGIAAVTTATDGTHNAGTVNIPLTSLYANGTYGWHYVTVDGQSSTSIYYMMGGAILYFDEDDYTYGDEALLTYEISDDYWDTGSTYKIAVYSATTGETIYSNTSIATKEDTAPFTFNEGISTGAYYAYLTKTTGSTTNTIGFDYAEVDAFLTFYGYVNNQSGYPIEGANVSIIQGDRSSYSTTIADGNYTSGTFYANYLTILNVTASGYSQYNVSLVPPSATRVYLNFTLNSTSPAVTGMGIGGIARDGIFDDATRMITKGYGRPIADATVYLWNFSTGQTYTKTTNTAGWYICDDGSSCSLVPGRIYDVQGRKGGYNNSVNYTVVTSS